MSPEQLLTAYDAEVRATVGTRAPASWTVETDGSLVLARTPHGGFVTATAPLTDLGDDGLAALVERAVAHFRTEGPDAAGVSFEWKTYDHDPPALVRLLRDRGLVAEPHEALVIGEAAALAGEPVLPPGLAMRTVTARADLDRVAAMESEVWGEDWSWLAEDLASRVASEADPDAATRVHVVEDEQHPERGVVSAAWLVPLPGTRFAGLWGGSTLAAYRGRGVYRALVARRAAEAVALGFPLLQVDASDDSRPILTRLGLQVVGGTTPYRWRPPS